MKSPSLSERENAGLRGPVKTVVDEYSTTVFDREGKTLEWRGNTIDGPTERTYSYDQSGRLIRITGTNADQVDEFRYDQRGRKTQIRHVPAQPNRGNIAIGFSIWFDSVAKGHTLTDGGTVETKYNERGQPVEIRVVDDEGTLLDRIEHIYDADGRLGEERLITENSPLPKAFHDQIPSEMRAEVLVQIKAKFESMMQQSGLFGNAQRTYLYDDQGRVKQRHMSKGPIREDLTFTYNDRGDIMELIRETSGFPGELGPHAEPPFSHHYNYEYDEYGNWTSRSETCEVQGNSSSRTSVRQLAYYS